jgi:signal transduction histidine kinase
MKNFIFSNKYLYISIILIFFCTTNLFSQTEKTILTKIEELKSTSDFKPQNSNYIDLILELAKNQVRSNPDSTAILLKEGYNLSLKSKYRAGESTALSTYAYLYFEKGEIEKAHDYNMRALEIAETYNLSKEKLKALNNMALDYLLQGESEKSLTKFLEALSTAKLVNDIDMMARININIASLYSDNGDYETSLVFLEKAKQLNIKHNKKDILPYTLINLASEYSEVEKYEEALDLVDKSILYFKKENIKDWLSHGYELKGTIELSKKNYQKALFWLKKSEELCDEIDFKYGYTIVYNGLSEAYLAINELEISEEYALKSLNVSTELNIAKSIEKSNLLLAEIYHKNGDDKKAYSYQKTYTDLYEKSSNEKFKKGLGILRSKIKFENQKKQLILDQNKAIAKQKNYVYLAISVSIIIFLILIFIYRTNKLQRKYYKELQKKQDILLKHEEELNLSIKTKDKLFSIIAHDLKGPINSFHLLMKMSMNESISKEDYDALFPKALQDIQGISDMLNNLLMWARTQMKGITLKQINVDINQIINKTISILQPIAKKKEINILNKVPESTISFSDRNHLSIVIRNLISNAIKFTKENGEIIIGVTELETEWQIEVADNGIGMNEDTLNMLFKNEHVKSTYGTNEEKGTGLGLSICKEMVEGNGGKIWATSIQNQGTIIYFTVLKKSDSEILV